jgi:hypothetical protein
MVRPLRAGEQFAIQVHYQYDSAIPPDACGGGKQFHFRMTCDGQPEYLGTSNW